MERYSHCWEEHWKACLKQRWRLVRNLQAFWWRSLQIHVLGKPKIELCLKQNSTEQAWSRWKCMWLADCATFKCLVGEFALQLCKYALHLGWFCLQIAAPDNMTAWIYSGAKGFKWIFWKICSWFRIDIRICVCTTLDGLPSWWLQCSIEL